MPPYQKPGGIGVIQPVSMVYVYKHDFREGIRLIRSLTDKPFGLNVLVEKTIKAYREQMKRWVNIAVEEGVKLFITALGDPGWVVDIAHKNDILVYHDAPGLKYAEKALEKGVDGINCVNNRAGGHIGPKTAEQMIDELGHLDIPLVCAGGVSNEQEFVKALDMGYSGVQMGTRFIATTECGSHNDYKQAVIKATEDDIVHTDKLSGLDCSVIKTPTIEKLGTKSNPITAWMLRTPQTKQIMRIIQMLKYLRNIKRASLEGVTFKDVWQAGKSSAGVKSIEPAGDIINRIGKAVNRNMQS